LDMPSIQITPDTLHSSNQDTSIPKDVSTPQQVSDSNPSTPDNLAQLETTEEEAKSQSPLESILQSSSDVIQNGNIEDKQEAIEPSSVTEIKTAPDQEASKLENSPTTVESIAQDQIQTSMAHVSEPQSPLDSLLSETESDEDEDSVKSLYSDETSSQGTEELVSRTGAEVDQDDRSSEDEYLIL